jgi:hypothetical protein
MSKGNGFGPSALSHFEIGGDKRISQHLFGSVPLANSSF